MVLYHIRKSNFNNKVLFDIKLFIHIQYTLYFKYRYIMSLTGPGAVGPILEPVARPIVRAARFPAYAAVAVVALAVLVVYRGIKSMIRF